MKLILFLQPKGCSSWREIITGVHRFARKHDWMLQVLEYPADVPAFRRFVADWRPDGCIIDCGNVHDTIDDRVLRDLPTVYLNPPPGCDCRRHSYVMQDSVSAARLATRELIGIGVRHYAFIDPASASHWSATRRRTFVEEIEKVRMPYTIIGETKLVDGIRALPCPCGVFAANDMLACKAIQAARLVGRNVPDDLAIVGIDNDIVNCEAQVPGITSVEPDLGSAGFLLGELMERAIVRPELPPTSASYGSIGIVRRGSTRLLKRCDSRVRKALELIRRSFSDPELSVERIVKEMGCSRSLALLRFKECTGHSIVDEIHDVRFQRACQLLKHTDKLISAIISECGYDSESFLKKYFKERTGESMREWRQKNAAES